MYPHCGYILLWSIQPLTLLSLAPLPPTPIFQQLSIHTLISSTFTDVRFYDIVDALSFPALFCQGLIHGHMQAVLEPKPTTILTSQCISIPISLLLLPAWDVLI
jgi:hypothetical protein